MSVHKRNSTLSQEAAELFEKQVTAPSQVFFSTGHVPEEMEDQPGCIQFHSKSGIRFLGDLKPVT